MSQLPNFDKQVDTKSGNPLIGKENGTAVIAQGTLTFRPIIDIKISKDEHQLELIIPGGELTLVTQPNNLFNEKKEVFLVFTSKETIARPIFNVVTPDPTDPNGIDKRRPTTILAIISRATGKPLHYDVEGGHITASISLSKSTLLSPYTYV